MKTFVSTSALLLTVFGFLGNVANADHRHGLVDLAHDLEAQMKQINRTVAYQFRTDRMFRAMAEDANDMANLVDEFHELAESNGCPKAMFAQAKKLCELNCELNDHLNDVRPVCGSRGSSRSHGCRFGSRYSFASGPTESDIRNLRDQLASLEETLEEIERQLSERIAALNRPVRVEVIRPVRLPAPPRPVTTIGHVSKHGWSIGFSIR